MKFCWQTIGASVRGATHTVRNLPNQDAWASASSDGAAYAAVSDGHGDKLHFRSATGARIAVEQALAEMRCFAPQGEIPSLAEVLELGRRISGRWNEFVDADRRANPFLPEEEAQQDNAGRMTLAKRPEVAYGATLLAAAATAHWIVYLQLGDGDILAVDAHGLTRRPVPGDPTLIGNRTTSLCNENAWQQMRGHVETEMPALVTLSTDGYANSFQTDVDFLQIGPDYLKMVRIGAEGLAARLPSLLNEATRLGSSDDVTLALLLRMENRKECAAKPLLRRLLAWRG